MFVLQSVASVQQDRSQSRVTSQLQVVLSTESPDRALKTVVQLLRENSEYYDWGWDLSSQGGQLGISGLCGRS